jgi:hypothetical protein
LDVARDLVRDRGAALSPATARWLLPLCYPKDVTPEMIASERARIARTAEQRPAR